ncbi:MAG TPA: elongation factor G, partial [Burkholderiales bacterium]|nr:elongation factor G [Burkholderiales bacterium]
NMGDITGDLASRRGQVSGTDSVRAGMVSIAGVVPLAEVASYQSRLKSLTGGHGSYQLEFSHYEPAPPNIQAQLKSEYQVKREED